MQNPKSHVMDDIKSERPVISPMSSAILPGDPPQLCPELLTLEEAIRFLRLDVDGPEKPELTLRRYREMGLLRATLVGRRIRYLRTELMRFLARKTENHRDSE